ncbi:MAG: lactate dehydrogenase [Candidatus Nitrosotenuis sp.]|nr:lactate dehydrogenase [Candidatus Nitrosotenuis sp.]
MISIIGSGKVGSAVGFLCGSFSLDNIVLINRYEKKAIGEALDISNAIPESSSISITGTSDYSKIKDSKVVVVTASSGVHLQSRTEIMYDQAKMIQKIASNIAKYAPDAKILMITNPVDVLVYVIQKEASFSSKNVIGVASNLDSSRFRYLLAQEFGTNQSKIQDAIVMGEHDDTMVPIFSRVKYDGKPVTDLLDDAQISKITLDVRNYWKYLRDYKGHSAFGIAKNTFDIINSIIKDETLDVPASVLLDGQYGLSDVCVGVPLTINKNGVVKIHQIEITQNEKESLSKSADTVKNNIAKVLEFLKN